jgi:hypothetical protein
MYLCRIKRYNKKDQSMKKSERMAELIRLWRTSKETEAVFCAKHKLKLRIFRYWLGKEVVEEEPSGFMEVIGSSDIPNIPMSGYVEVAFPQGAVMRFRGVMSEGDVRVLKSLLY